MPEISREELQKRYGPGGDYNSWRQRYAEDYLKSIQAEPEEIDNSKEEQNAAREEHLRNRGDVYKQKEAEESETNSKLDTIEKLKIDLSTKVSDIIGNSMKKGDESFLNELKQLMAKYDMYSYKIDPNAKSVNINEPFTDPQGNVIKFSDLPKTDGDYERDSTKRRFSPGGTS
jgi:hypothetical protein